MKNIILGSFFLLIGFQSIAQEKSVLLEDEKIYSFVDKKASAKEGTKVFYQNFIKEFNIRASSPKANDIKLRLKFVVEKDGSLSNITVEGTDDLYTKEAIRVINNSSKWNPAEVKNEIVRSYFILPIIIDIPDELIHEIGYVSATPMEGLSSFMDKFWKEFKFDKTLIKKGEIGSFRINFTIEIDGSLTHIYVTEDKYNVGADVERVIILMQPWKPATQNGKIVRSEYFIPVEIDLDKNQRSYWESKSDNVNSEKK